MSRTTLRHTHALLAAALGFTAGAFAEAPGLNALRGLCNSPPPPSFGKRYGSNPRSTGNRDNGRGAVARQKRAAKRRRNIRRRSAK